MLPGSWRFCCVQKIRFFRQPQSPAITEQAISTLCRGLGLAERSALNEAAGHHRSYRIVSVHNACFERIDKGTVPVALNNGPHGCFLGIALLERLLDDGRRLLGREGH